MVSRQGMILLTKKNIFFKKRCVIQIICHIISLHDIEIML